MEERFQGILVPWTVLKDFICKHDLDEQNKLKDTDQEKKKLTICCIQKHT